MSMVSIMRLPLMLCMLCLFFSLANVQSQQAEEISYLSAADDTMQPARFYDPGSESPVPMVVALHSWSGDYTQQTHLQFILFI